MLQTHPRIDIGPEQVQIDADTVAADRARLDALLDAALDATFPASDPIALSLEAPRKATRGDVG